MNDENKQQESQTTVYDTTLKDIVKQQVRDILPVLLPGAIYESTVNVELIRPTLRADKAFRIWHQGEEKNYLDGASLRTNHDYLQKVREVLNMYDSLWEENPKVRQIQAKAAEEGRKEGLSEGRREGLSEGRKEGLSEGRKEGLSEGLTKGRVESSQELVMKIVRRRFPKLAEPAVQRVTQIRSYEALDMLMDQLLDAPDEATARILLRLSVA